MYTMFGVRTWPTSRLLIITGAIVFGLIFTEVAGYYDSLDALDETNCELNMSAYSRGIYAREFTGVSVDIVDHPYIASLQHNNVHYCCGSIIRKDVILTAAICVLDWKKWRISVRVGTTMWNAGGKLHAVYEVVLHRNYLTLNHPNLALVRLKVPVTYGPTVRPIQLFESYEIAAPNSTVNIVGWGWHPKPCNKYLPKDYQLKKLNVELLDYMYDCASSWVDKPVHGIETFFYHQFCTTATYEGSCKQNIGGPVLSKGRQVGVVSWFVGYGKGCSGSYWPNVHIDLASYRNWVDNTIAKMN